MHENHEVLHANPAALAAAKMAGYEPVPGALVVVVTQSRANASWRRRVGIALHPLPGSVMKYSTAVLPLDRRCKKLIITARAYSADYAKHAGENGKPFIVWG